MNRIFGIVFACVLMAAVQARAATITVTPDNASIVFSVTHDLGYTVGCFRDFSATLDVNDQHQVTGFRARVQTASIDTRSSVRDEGLRSPIFLDTAKFPHAVFEGAGAEPGRIAGTMTIKGAARPMTLQVEQEGGKTLLKGTFNREDFGVNFNRLLPNKKPEIGKDVQLTIEINA